MIKVDGSYGEGGGQILRTALMLSTLLNKPFTIKNIRSGRKKPGLKNSHLTCVRILQELCDAKVTGDFVGSNELTFSPGKLKKSDIKYDIGTAGSITLVLQCLTLPLIESNSTLTIIGGTDVAWSPSMDYFKYVIAPVYDLFGDLTIEVKKRGFFPKGKGKVIVKAEKNELSRQYKILTKNGGVEFVGKFIATDNFRGSEFLDSEINKVKNRIAVDIKKKFVKSASEGHVLSVIAKFDNCALGVDSLGELDISKLIEYLDSPSAVDPNLADNLIPLIALKGGSFTTSLITEHTKTNIYISELFTNKKIEIKDNLISCKI